MSPDGKTSTTLMQKMPIRTSRQWLIQRRHSESGAESSFEAKDVDGVFLSGTGEVAAVVDPDGVQFMDLEKMKPLGEKMARQDAYVLQNISITYGRPAAHSGSSC